VAAWLTDRADAVDQRPAEVPHRPHHGVPTDAEHGRDRGDVEAVLTDEPAGFPAGPLSQTGPASHLLAGL